MNRKFNLSGASVPHAHIRVDPPGPAGSASEKLGLKIGAGKRASAEDLPGRPFRAAPRSGRERGAREALPPLRNPGF